MNLNSCLYKTNRIILILFMLSIFLISSEKKVSARPALGTFSSCNDVTEIPTFECNALEALYTSTSGSNWTNHTDWLQTDTPCSWYGVSCGMAGGNIVSLGLPNNKLSGSIPSTLSDLSELEYLDLSNNLLSGVIPPQIGMLTNLKSLLLYNNQIIGLFPTTIVNLVNLVNLSFDCWITSADPGIIAFVEAVVPGWQNNSCPSGSISGEVTEQGTGNQLTGAQICANEYDTGFDARCVQSDAFGNFTIAGLKTLDYRINALADGKILEYYNGTYDRTSASRVAVLSGSSTPNINFVLEPGGSVSGHVFESDGVTPVVGARVRIAILNVNQPVLTDIYTVDGGYYLLSGLAPRNDYKIEASKNGYLRAFYPAVPLWGQATTVTVQAGQTTENRDIKLLKTDGFIIGRSTYEDGSPAKKVWMEAFHPDGWFVGISADDNGEFAIPVIKGTWQVFPYQPPLVTTIRNIVVDIGQTVSGINFVLHAGGSISGTTRDSSNNTIQSVQVCVNDFDTNSNSKCVQSDSSGNYTVGGLLHGDYRVYALVNGKILEYYNGTYDRNLAARVVVTSGTVTPSINFILEPGGSISGHVFESDGVTPVVNATLRIAYYDVNQQFRTDVSSVVGGYYQFTGLAPRNDYKIQVSANGYLRAFYPAAPSWGQASTISVQAGQTTINRDIKLQKANAYITGKTTFEDGSPAANVWMEAFHQDGWFVGINANGDGEFSIPVLKGTWQVFPHLPPLMTAPQDVIVDTGQTVSGTDFVLHPVATISGHVYQDDGITPISGAIIYVLDSNFEWVNDGHSAPDGSYEIGLFSGSYYFAARASGFGGEYYDNVNDGPGASLLVLTAPEVTPNINFRLAPESTISGHVYQSNGTTPIPGASVRAWPKNGGLILAAPTYDDGSFMINGLATGEYIVQVIATGYASKYFNDTYSVGLASPVTVTQPAYVSDINFSLYTSETTSPTVYAIVRADSNPINASSVNFTVTFSEAVRGVDVLDFLPVETDITGSAVTNVSGSGAIYSVTVSTGSGDGTLRLDVRDNDSILDLAGNPLGGAGTGNGDFNTGELYTIDHTLFTNCAEVIGIPSSECDVLRALYISTAGESWTTKTNWLQKNTPCDWYGIICSDSHVVQINLSENNLSGPLPSALGTLSNLMILNLWKNPLTGGLPSWIGDLTNLTELYLSDTQLTGEIPASIMNLVKINRLGVNCKLISSNETVAAFIDQYSPGWRVQICQPKLIVDFGSVETRFWTGGVGITFTLSVDDPATPVNPDFIRESATPYFEIPDYPLKAGYLVTLTDGTTTKSITFIDQSLTKVDVLTSQVKGISVSSKPIQVTAVCDKVSYFRNIVPTPGVEWSVDFSKKGSQQNEDGVVALNYRCGILNRQFDGKGNSSGYYWPYRSGVQADPNNDRVSAEMWPPETRLHLEIDDPSTVLLNPDYTVSVVAGQPDEFGDTSLTFNLGDYDLKVGDIVTVHAGPDDDHLDEYQTYFTVDNIEITSVNVYDDIVYGKADIGQVVKVWAAQDPQSMYGMRTAEADDQGVWFVNFSIPDTGKSFEENLRVDLLPESRIDADINTFTTEVSWPTNKTREKGAEGGIIFRPDANMDIPAGALAVPIEFNITDGGNGFQVITTNEGIIDAITSVTIGPEGTLFDIPVTITLDWPDADNNGVVDDTSINETDLYISKNGLVIAGPCSSDLGHCDTDANTYAVQVSSLSYFVVGSPATNHEPTVDAATFYISETITNGTVVGTISFSDVDTGQNHTCSILDGNSSDVFAINPTTCTVTVHDASQISELSRPGHEITVRVTDNGSPARHAEVSIKINILPGGFSKSSPGTGSPVTLPVTIAWGASTGASNYEYCIIKTINFNTCSWLSNGTATSKLLSSLTPGAATYYWQVRAVNAVGKTYANGSATSFWTFKTIASSPPFYSAGAQDGWILESKETSSVGGTQNPTGTTLLVGDAVGDKQYRSILSFDTSALPDKAVVVSATLKLRKYSLVVGTDPFKTHIGMVFDMRKPYFGATSLLVVSDFQAAATLTNAGSFSSAAVSNWYSAILSVTARNNINKTGLTQFRVRFAKDDNDDNGNDYFAFYSGNYGVATYRPTLLVTYYLP